MTRCLRAGELSSRDLLGALLARIKAHNQTINAVITLDEADAFRQADEADAALARDEITGPLHGLPMTVKDGYHTRGMRTTCGLPRLKKYVPKEDATLVSRLRKAGAIILGKSNLPFASYDWQCRHPNFGRCNNPYDVSRTSGGSSGGAAAGLAMGFTPLELGTDLAGSLRIPAHCCGVVSLRPTEKRLSDYGAHRIPGYAHISSSMVSCGPLARSIADLQLMMPVLSGVDERRWEVPPVPWREVPKATLAGLKVAFCDSFTYAPSCRRTREAMAAFVQKLIAAGCVVERCQPSGLDWPEALENWGVIQASELTQFLPRIALWPPLGTLARHAVVPYFFGNSLFTRGVKKGLRSGKTHYPKAIAARNRLVAAMDRFLSEYHVFLCPVAATPAFEHRRPGKALMVDGARLRYGDALGGYNCPLAVTGVPVATLPIGFTEQGLPIGVQICARRWQDESLLAIAAEMEALGEGFRQPPDFQ